MEILKIKNKLAGKKVFVRGYRFLKVIVCHISPKLNSKMNYYTTFGKKLDLKNPVEFNAKLMYLKLNNYIGNETVWKCSDKYGVREYAIKNGISTNNLTTLYGVYNNAKDIEFQKFPNKFVLKCSHGCGFNYIVEDKNNINIKKVRKVLNKWLRKKFGYEGGELQYTKTKPVIMCEEFIESQKGEYPFDYKLYCFHGIPKVVLVCSNRKNETKLNYFDLQWNYLPIGKKEFESSKKIEKPQKLADMIEIAKSLSKPFPFVRIDFYEYHGKAILGEMTFTPAANCAQYYSEEGNKYLSEMLDLNI